MKTKKIILLMVIAVLSIKLNTYGIASMTPINYKDMYDISEDNSAMQMIDEALAEGTESIKTMFGGSGDYIADPDNAIVAYENSNSQAIHWTEQGQCNDGRANSESYLIPVYGTDQLIGFVNVSYDYEEKRYVARPHYALTSYIGWLDMFGTKEKAVGFAAQGEYDKVNHSICFFSYYDGVIIYLDTNQGEKAVSYNFNGVDNGKVYDLNVFLQERAAVESENLKHENNYDKDGNLLFGGQVRSTMIDTFENHLTWIIIGFIFVIGAIVLAIAYFLKRRKKTTISRYTIYF